MSRVARLVQQFGQFNALNARTVNVYFQSYPGPPERDQRGIEDLEYSVRVDGEEVQSGRTGANGRVRVRLEVGKTTTVRAMGTDYELSALGALHPIEEFRGVQQRLGMLGYYAETLHGDNRRADTLHNPNEATERALLHFQADNNCFPDAMFGTRSRQALVRVMRNTRGE